MGRIFRRLPPGLLSVALLCSLVSSRAEAIVWQKGCEPQRLQTAEMRSVGKLYYSKFEILGGSCVAIGGRWVLTSRHGTKDFSAQFLSVVLPALSDETFQVQAIHFPPRGDIALLELNNVVENAAPLRFISREDLVGQKAWVGGFGFSGEPGKLNPPGSFFGGFNLIERTRNGKLSIRMSDPKTAGEQESLPMMMDSGSPMFVRIENRWRLAGIASTVSNATNPRTGDWGNYAAIAPIKSWIEERIK